jgi:hypothetical protein
MKRFSPHAGKRAFTSSKVPVASLLGRDLIFGKYSESILAAVRLVAVEGKKSEKISLDDQTENKFPKVK